jgi:hypothetical protein
MKRLNFEKEYDLDQMKSRPNPFAKQLKQQITNNFTLGHRSN